MKKFKKMETTIRLPGELKEQLQREAEEDGITLRDHIVIILRKWLQNAETK